MEKTKISRDGRVRAARMLLLVYVLLLIFLLFLQRAETARLAWDDYSDTAQINLVPFATVDRYVRAIRAGRVVGIAYVNLLGNLALFMPMGVLLPFAARMFQKPWRFLLLMAVLLPAVEALQLLLRCGCCDVDDVILNFFGALLAYALALPLARSLNRLDGGNTA